MDAKSETLRPRIFNLCARSRDVPVLRLKIQKVFTSNHIVVACKYLANFLSEHRNIAGTCTQIEYAWSQRFTFCIHQLNSLKKFPPFEEIPPLFFPDLKQGGNFFKNHRIFENFPSSNALKRSKMRFSRLRRRTFFEIFEKIPPLLLPDF